MTRLLYCCVVFFLSFTAEALQPNDIIKKADAYRAPEGAFSFVVAVADFKNGKTDRVTKYRVVTQFSDAEYNSLVDTIHPERQRGRKLLMRGNDLWFYVPTVKRPTRVSFRERLTGEVANGDIARTNYAHDYSAKLEKVEKKDGKRCHRLLLTAKNKDVAYSKITYWVEVGSYKPVRADYYALSGKVLKTGEFKGFKKSIGRTFVSRMVVTDAVQKSRRSELSYSDYKKEKLDPSFFNKESLTE